MSKQKPTPSKRDESESAKLQAECARVQAKTANDNQKEWSLEPFPDGWYADC